MKCGMFYINQSDVQTDEWRDIGLLDIYKAGNKIFIA
jgi:aspartyl/asparaginyl beta-hydroxylase (cupin superfamily)